VRITGAVFRPDVYQLTPGLRVADLIRKADGLKEDAFTGRGQIIRLQEDLSRSIVSFDVKKALAGDASNNDLLHREDEVLISSVLDLRDSFKVTIQGEVRIPGQYDYIDNLTLKDLILQAGGFTDAAFKNIEIARLIKRDSIASTDRRASSILYTEINGDLSSASANISLQAFDVITIRRKAGYTLPETVIVMGQVQFPGPYALNSRNERVSDLLKRAGGYTPDAYPEGAFLKRYKTDAEKFKMQQDERIERQLRRSKSDTSSKNMEEAQREYDQIPLDLPSILNSPGSIEDLILRSSDELFIPKFDGQVKVDGSVLMATQVPYQAKNNLKDYINEAGGFSGNAWRKKAYVVYANGKAATTRHFLFFKFYPKVLPGSTVKVPPQPEKQKINTGEALGIATALTGLAGVVIAILRL
jgi:protein involved in polysaccharide export with SLBB domain